MSPSFKAIYGQECLIPLCLASPNFSILVATKETLEDMDQQLHVLRKNSKNIKVRKKIYANLKCLVWMFKEGT